MKTNSEFHRQADQVQAEVSNALAAIDPTEAGAFIQQIMSAGRIFVAGKGRTGLQMQAFAMRLMHLGLDVHMIGESTTPGLRAGDLLLIGSASGKTGSLVTFAQVAKAQGAVLAAVTANRESVIAKAAGTHVYIPAPSHKKQDAEDVISVLPLGGLFESALGVALSVFVLQLMDALGVTESEMAARHANLE
jgi:6-phospho-3-hexuloisomerase